MTRSLQFSWELSGSGWATCRIWDGSTKHRDIVSYCTNALADLLRRLHAFPTTELATLRHLHLTTDDCPLQH